jgi:hypothetical protein
MTKFGKTEKIGQSSLTLWMIRFRQFQNWAKEEGKHEDFEAQECLRHEKGRRNIKEPTYVLMIKFSILRKLECPIFQTKNNWLLQLRDDQYF